MEKITDLIQKRVSCRTFSVNLVEENKKKQLSDFLTSNRHCPFGGIVTFHLIDLTEMDRQEVNMLGTYGVIKGAPLFIVGTVSKGPRAMENYGYSMEKNILKATELGFGTCWLGGTFNKSGFAKRINLTDNALLPAISPVGYPAGKKSVIENIFRYMAGSKKRKSWNDLFYNGGVDTPFDANRPPAYREIFESVRLAPSASNKQPWRIVKEKDADVFHFYLERTKGYDKQSAGIQLQNIDMGIAMCHFELVAKASGLSGRWEDDEPDIQTARWVYITTWSED